MLFRMVLQLHNNESQSIMLQHTGHRPRRQGVRSTYAQTSNALRQRHAATKKGSSAAEDEGFCENFLAFGSAEHAPSEHYAKFATGMTEVAEDVSWSSNLDTTSVWTMWAAITRQLTTRGVLGNSCLKITR